MTGPDLEGQVQVREKCPGPGPDRTLDSLIITAGSAPSTSLPKHNIDVTSSVDPRDSEDEDTDDHPRPCMFLIV